MPVSISGTSGVTFNDTSLQEAAASPYVLKNRIINGAMVVDQRNAGASVTPTADATYSLDRWRAGLTASSKYSVQQNAAAVTPPVGFSNYLGVTSLSAYSVGSGDIFTISQRIEGFNTADLSFGTANAKTITISFWVRSSLTGTFGGSITNSAENRFYPFTYTISVANTWEQKSITIAGDTSGTWIGSTNGLGMSVWFGLGGGSTYSGTASAWGTSGYTATGATSVVGTNGATFYITGVQLEQNTVATPFERRLYNQELANCQRYYQKLNGSLAGYSDTGTAMANYYRFICEMRSAPTIAITTGPSYVNASSLTSDESTVTGSRFYASATATGRLFATGFIYTCSAEL